MSLQQQQILNILNDFYKTNKYSTFMALSKDDIQLGVLLCLYESVSSLPIATPDKPTIVTNLLSTLNYNFDKGLTNWQLYGIQDNPLTTIDNKNILQFGLTANSYVFLSTVTIEINTKYRFGCKGKVSDNQNSVYMYVKRATPPITKPLIVSDIYIENSVSFTATDTKLECGVGIENKANRIAALIDSFFLYKE